MTDLTPVIDLLAANLGRLVTSDGEYYDYIPMLADLKVYGAEAGGPEKDIKRDIAEGIALLLDNHGMLRQPDSEDAGKIVSITCALCSGNLFTFNTARPISGKLIIEAIGQRDPSCSTKHAKLTPEMIRQRIQEAENV